MEAFSTAWLVAMKQSERIATNQAALDMCNLSTYLLTGGILTIFVYCSVKGGISMRIHPFPARPRLLAVVMTLATLLLLVPVAAYAQANTANGFYQQTNLVSDLPNIAKFQDPNLLNPSGLSHGPTTPWWVSDNGAGVATLYNRRVQAFPLSPSSPLLVTIPPPAGSPAGTTAS